VSRNGDEQPVSSCGYPSPVGPLRISATEKGICGLAFERVAEKHAHASTSPSAASTRRQAHLDEAKRQLDEYFDRKRTEFDVPLDLISGTPFQRAVWKALQTIGYGETASYGDIAAAVGRPKAARAVGGANNRNPVAIIIPCHRVIGADGSLVGFGGGLQIKRKLLDLEAGR
jgi:O-6-methylguanine DNA methyltransferase